MHLLFWLSLFPLTTEWLRHYPTAPAPVAVYGVVLLMAAIAYYILQRNIICAQGKDSILKQALGRDIKGKLSPILYITGVAFAFIAPLVSCGIYVFVALIWLIPDRRIEKRLSSPSS